MNKAKHTPGEWRVTWCKRWGGDEKYAQVSGPEFVIVNGCAPGSCPEEATANIVLMASAPGLLAACQGLLSACESSPRFVGPAVPTSVRKHRISAMKEADAAIAKATGEGN